LPRSIYWRLQLWSAILLIGVVASLGITFYEHQWAKRIHQVDAALEARLAALIKVVHHCSIDTSRPLLDHPTSPFGEPDGVYYFVIWCRNGAVLRCSHNAPPDITPPLGFQRDMLSHFRTRRSFREVLHCSDLGDCVMAGRSVQADWDAMRGFGWVLLGGGGAMLAFGLGLSWWLVTRVVRPIEQSALLRAAFRKEISPSAFRFPIAAMSWVVSRACLIPRSTESNVRLPKNSSLPR
jgi:hypothetical protein